YKFWRRLALDQGCWGRWPGRRRSVMGMVLPRIATVAARGLSGCVAIRVLSNLRSFGPLGGERFENHYCDFNKSGLRKLAVLVLAAFRSYRYDVVFLDCAAAETIVLGLFKCLLPFNHSKLVTADLILRVPKTRSQRLSLFIKRIALRRVR